MRRCTPLSATLLACARCSLVLAPVAHADNDGRGFYGATDDKVVTNAGFILIVFFPLFVLRDEPAAVAAGEAQGSAQGRRARRTCGDAHWRGGW